MGRPGLESAGKRLGNVSLRERLPRVVPGVARSLRRLFGQGLEAEVEIGGATSRWAPCLLDPPPKGPWWVCAGPLHSVAVALQADGWVDPIGGSAWADYTGDARTLAWALAHETLLTHLGALLGEDLMVRREATSRPPELRSATLDLRAEHGEASTTMRLSLSADTLAILASRECWEPRSDRTRRPRPVPLHARISLPRVSLPAAELRATRPGDWLLVGRVASVWDQLGLTFGNPANEPIATARWRSGRLELAQWSGGKARFRPMEFTMTQSSGEEEPAASRASGDAAPAQHEGEGGGGGEGPQGDTRAPEAAPVDIPVHLTVQLGDLELSYARLNELQPGYVIELDNPIDTATVRLYANGRAFGRGQLVTVGEQLAVRVTEVEERGPGNP